MLKDNAVQTNFHDLWHFGFERLASDQGLISIIKDAKKNLVIPYLNWLNKYDCGDIYQHIYHAIIR